ncbi:lasso RiPP family leader peptide-containing protein [Amycolatopsis sp. H6(2020)]|nr:lasso RiPP family leader peptide-containing protein [Amycolatopsis sp. H6(2020)]
MVKENYEAPTIVELGDFGEETGFIGPIYYEGILLWHSWF